MARARSVALKWLPLTAYLALSQADLLQFTHPNTAFAPPQVQKIVPSIDLTEGIADYTTLRFVGTVTAPASAFMNFTVETEGMVRLWVSDHLLVENTTQGLPQNVTALFAVPWSTSTPQPVRLEYTHFTGRPLLRLWWSGNNTGLQVVPSNAFAPTMSSAEQERAALRERMYSPPIRWQTAYNPSMTTHVYMPAGFALQFTLAVPSQNMTLGDVIVFRQGSPALTQVGPHSYSGDITELTISAWSGLDCTVLLQSSVLNDGQDLGYLATSAGADCSSLVLLVQPAMLWGRAGFITAPQPCGLEAALPGFANVSVYAGQVCAPVTNITGLYIAIPLATIGENGGIASFSTGKNYTVSTIRDAIASARANQLARYARYGNLSDVYEAMQSVIAWNTIYHPDEGSVTPVSRGWDFGAGYVIFDWDNLFLAYMSSLEGGESKDISYSNLIQILLARTLDGFVPNFSSGLRKSYDRTEPQIGAYVTREIFRKWKDAWVVELVFDALLSWNDWVWAKRRGEGALAPPGGTANLIVLGTDPTQPPGDWATNTMQGARYESGLDNSPMYDGPDVPGGGPVTFNASTHHMQVYDVGMSALYLSDTAALIDLAAVANRTDIVPELQDRFAAVATAMNTYMWDPEAGMYTNVLYNGSFYKRYAPTSFFPMLAGIASDEQAEALVATLTSPLGFCVNATHNGPNSTRMLVDFWNSGNTDNCACSSDACIRERILQAYGFVRVEALVAETTTPGAALVPLQLYLDTYTGDHALTTPMAAPTGNNYSLVRTEGYCFQDSSPGLVNLTLWYSQSRRDYQTCGTAACLNDTQAYGYTFVAHLCYAYNASVPAQWPCKFGCPSVARSDPAFTDNTYWRGRIWGPHLQLVYWALREYDHIPSVRAARLVLVQQGKALMLQDWKWFRHVNENMNGFIGVGSDVNDADPFYHWGALPGFLSFIENGFVYRICKNF